MSWDAEIPIIVRTLINDLGDQPTYSDDRIKQIIAVAAKYVQFDVVLDRSYNVDVIEGNISPDPTDHNDEIFISLVSLKAACIIDQSVLRTKAALEGIRASLGSATLTVKGSLEGFIKILEKGPCASYDELTSHWDVSQATAIRAILSPFVGNKFDPRSLFSDNRGRDLY
jgi:hypothetical protein